MDPALEGSAVQVAVDAATQAYREHRIDDIEDRLRSELCARGIEIDDDTWIDEVAGMIRAGVPVVVGDSDYLGGETGGRHRAAD